MSARESEVDRLGRHKRDEDELYFIRVVEKIRRTRLIMDRDNVSETVAKQKAEQWMNDELGVRQLSLPIAPARAVVYRIYYRQVNDPDDSEYRLLDAVVKGRLYDWPATHSVLGDIIRDRFDSLCHRVITFHETREHNHRIEEHSLPVKDNPSPVKDNPSPDELSKRRRIVELEDELQRLRSS